MVQQSDRRKSSIDNKGLLNKRSSVIQLDCRKPLTIFHLLLFGVTTKIIIRVGNVVASSLSLVSAVRAKFDIYYLQRQVSISQATHSHITKINQTQIREIYHRWMWLAPVPVSKREITMRCNTYYRRH